MKNNLNCNIVKNTLEDNLRLYVAIKNIEEALEVEADEYKLPNKNMKKIKEWLCELKARRDEKNKVMDLDTLGIKIMCLKKSKERKIKR